MFDLIKNRNYFFALSGAAMLLGVLFIAIFGFRMGIDLQGGTQWNVAFSGATVSDDAITAALRGVKADLDIAISHAEDGSVILRLPALTNEEHQTYAAALEKLGSLTEKSYSAIGPVIGTELRGKAIEAIIFVLIGISLYIGFAFRKVTSPVKSWKFGIVTLGTLFHDVVIPAGLVAALGHWAHVDMDTNSIVALLVVMGFSVHDTIVVFDRIREHLLLARGRKVDLALVVNQSVNETFVRSLNTSLTLVLVLVALLLIGPSPLFYFILTILVGVVFGTYSSIFIASPLLYLWGRGTGK